jgi:DedD protein
MDDKNELSDIVLNKGDTAGPNKKIILAVATLGVVLIIVVMLMNSMNSGSTQNLPQAVLPPKPQKEIAQEKTADEPLFEEVEVVQEQNSPDEDLDKIAQKLKQQSKEESEEKEITTTEKKVTHQKKPKLQQQAVRHKKRVQQAISTVKYYIQVGSFSKYEPNKKFLASIKNAGFNYTYHKVGNLNKVLVGPFKTQKEAQRAKKVLRSKVEPGAFLVKL